MQVPWVALVVLAGFRRRGRGPVPSSRRGLAQATRNGPFKAQASDRRAEWKVSLTVATSLDLRCKTQNAHFKLPSTAGRESALVS